MPPGPRREGTKASVWAQSEETHSSRGHTGARDEKLLGAMFATCTAGRVTEAMVCCVLPPQHDVAERPRVPPQPPKIEGLLAYVDRNMCRDSAHFLPDASS